MDWGLGAPDQATAVNDLAAHYTRLDFNSVAPQHVVAPSSVGFAITPQVTTGAQTIPTISLGAPYFTLGGTNNGPQPRVDGNMQFDDIFSKTFGHHNLKFGYDFRKFSVVNSFLAVQQRFLRIRYQRILSARATSPSTSFRQSCQASPRAAATLSRQTRS